MTKMEKYWSNDVEEDYDDTGEILIHCDTRLPVTGMVWEDYANGNRRYEGIHLNGRKHGYEKWWHENGVLEMITVYFNNKEHGEVSRYNSNKFLDTKCEFSYGYLIWIEFYENGILKKKETIEEGRSASYTNYLEKRLELRASGEDKLWDEHLAKWMELWGV